MLAAYIKQFKITRNQDKKEMIANYYDLIDFFILLMVGKQKLSTLLTLVIVKEPHKYNGNKYLGCN